jgi:trigger factor
MPDPSNPIVTKMKVEFADVNETRKRLTVEIPSDLVDAEFDRVTAQLAHSVKVPGFRPGKVPTGVVRQRFRDDILHEVAHTLVPKALDEALDQRKLDPIDTPEVRDVVVEPGQPLTFTATIDTVPDFDPGNYRGITLRKKTAVVDDAAVDEALERLRQRGARFEPVEGRPLSANDWAAVDLEREVLTGEHKAPRETHKDVTIELGAEANPPGFDAELIGLTEGASKAFTITYPADFAVADMAGAQVEYRITLKGVKQRILPALDDEFAKDLGSFDSLSALRDRVRHDMEHEAQHESDRELRGDLLTDLAKRVPFTLPDVLVERELDRRVEELARRMVEQHMDPRTAGVDWNELRNSQREAATESVKATLVLDEAARREAIEVSDEDLDAEVNRFAERSGRSAAAVRAHIEQDNGLARLRSGLRREKTMDFLLSNASITTAS